MLIMIAMATVTDALPQYAAATGQPCATCHVNPAGGGPRNATGQAFEAIPTHSTDPAGAFAQISHTAPAPAPTQAPAPAATQTPAPAPAPTQAPAPAVSSPVSVSISGWQSDDSVTYEVVIRNTGKSAIGNVYVAGAIPNGAAFTSVTNTPSGTGFLSSNGGSAAWVAPSIPAGGIVGPFGYKVSKGNATDLTVVGFAHWLSPSDGTAATPPVTPLTAAQKADVDQSIRDQLNTADNSLALWSLQAGNGPRMVDFARDVNLAWFAGQAQNWTMALYELNDQFPGDASKLELRNPTLAPSVKNFETTSVQPVVDAIKAKDLNAFNAAYDKMIAGCNSCHAARADSKSVKIIRPTAPIVPNIDFGNAATTAGTSETEPVGKALYQTNCAACHLANGAGGLNIGSATSADLRAPGLETTYNNSDALISRAILTGKDQDNQDLDPVMPRFQGRLTQDQVTQIISYLKTLH